MCQMMSPGRGVLNMVSSSRAPETSVAAAWNSTRLWGNGVEGATERGRACYCMCAAARHWLLIAGTGDQCGGCLELHATVGQRCRGGDGKRVRLLLHVCCSTSLAAAWTW